MAVLPRRTTVSARCAASDSAPTSRPTCSASRRIAATKPRLPSAVAITLALDAYGTDEKRALKWLERCGVKYPKYHYQTALNRVAAVEVR
jgi:hypothetical protein